MTSREKEILELIKKNPLISQKAIGEKLNITRSSVGVHITNLIKKGYIKGRGYVMNKSDYVTVIGAANIDIHGFTEEKLIERDSNPGLIKICLGGVGRNISENLARLGIDTKLISVTGGDINSKRLIDECNQIGIDMEHSLILPDQNASIYLAIMDEKGDMSIALSDMSIVDRMTPEFIKSKYHIIKNSEVIVVDTCLSRQVIEYILTNFKDKKILLDPVSIIKARRVKDIIGGFHTIKLNKHEAEFLSGIKIEDAFGIKKAVNYFIDKGVKRVFITLGDKGVYYGEGNYTNTYKPPKIKVVNTTGAGDAFMAGIVYGILYEKDIDEIAKFSTAAAIVAVKHPETVNPNMSIESINKIMEEIEC
ncbi:carbohydrate kinase [Vallitalea sp.]|jgi:pseudouridine kinase|uniref:carbohydrate kinase n=1 Tax=Vallitalea sp. TaxID=1882829 RepID=UPI0025D28FED|nr:carbohydrate kinase [Vallitalea sp.]MCT4688577.1 winged helix-turn-helix transcriptional regulator [Vallitalea sp.]